jgi:hypothetical protein
MYPATGVHLNELGQNHRPRRTPPRTPDDANSTRYVHLFTCFAKRLFYTEIKVENNHLDDDKRMFEKLNRCYWRARGHLGRMSLVHNLTGMRVVN